MLCWQTNRCLTVLAPAKLNLFLRIVARRPDGFHDIESVMSAINLYDTLTFQPNDSSEFEFEVVDNSTRSVAGSMKLEAPIGPDNLVLRAANLLRITTSCTLGARISLTKRIPSSAGLGGGSSDCAATLLALNRMWNLHLSRADLVNLAAQLGSDVAFFLSESPVSLCTGRGEKLTPLRCSSHLHFVVAKPKSGLSTPAVYRECRPDPENHPVQHFIDAVSSGSAGMVAQRLHNGLQSPAELISEDVRRIRDLFQQMPVVGHQMSGSGSSYFGICSSRRHALWVAGRLRSASVPWVHVARTCP